MSSSLAATPRWQARLHAKGYRLTPQRQPVLEAVAHIGRATPEQILAAVQLRAVGVNIATVYRALYLLEELRLVQHTHLRRGAPSFSRAGAHEHVHLVCRDCATVLELPGEVMDDLAARLADQQGLALDVGHAAFYEVCATCAAAGTDG